MLSRLIKFISALVLLLAIYVSSVLLTGFSAESVLNRGLQEANAYLSAQQQLLGTPLTLSYVREQKSLLQESGVFLVKNELTGQEVKLPTSLHYGCLSIDGQVNLYHFLNNLFLKKGILDLSSEAAAVFKLNLFNRAATLTLSLDGAYTQDYLKRDFKHLFGFNRRLDAKLRLHRNLWGTVNSELCLSHLAHPNFTVKQLIVQGVNAQHPDFEHSRMHLYLAGLFAHGTVFDDLNGLNLELSTTTDPALDRLSLNLSGSADTTRGQVKTALNLTPLSLESLKQNKVSLLSLMLKPLSFSRFAPASGSRMLFENFAFAADYQGYTGHVRYQTQAEGELWVPQSESLLNALNQLKGKFRVEFSDLNEAGRRSIESLGSEYVSSQGTLLVSDVIISEGNLLLNGKDYR